MGNTLLTFLAATENFMGKPIHPLATHPDFSRAGAMVLVSLWSVGAGVLAMVWHPFMGHFDFGAYALVVLPLIFVGPLLRAKSLAILREGMLTKLEREGVEPVSVYVFAVTRSRPLPLPLYFVAALGGVIWLNAHFDAVLAGIALMMLLVFGGLIWSLLKTDPDPESELREFRSVLLRKGSLCFQILMTVAAAGAVPVLIQNWIGGVWGFLLGVLPSLFPDSGNSKSIETITRDEANELVRRWAEGDVDSLSVRVLEEVRAELQSPRTAAGPILDV